MADLVIHDDLAKRLREIARRQNQTVEEMLTAIVEQYKSSVGDEMPIPGTPAALAASARRAGLRSPQPVDTSERTKEILNSEYADYLKRRMDEQSNTD